MSATAARRHRAAYEYVAAKGWEIYGRPSRAALEQMRQAAAASGVSLKVEPVYLHGFMRLARGDGR